MSPRRPRATISLASSPLAETNVEALRDAIRDLHGCESRWVEAVPVTETFEGETVWEGVVQVFDLIDHPKAKRAYAWSHETDEGKRRYVAVLHSGGIDSPVNAVKAAIVADYQKGS